MFGNTGEQTWNTFPPYQVGEAPAQETCSANLGQVPPRQTWASNPHLVPPQPGMQTLWCPSIPIDPRPSGSQFLDPNVINDTIKKYFGVQLKPLIDQYIGKLTLNEWTDWCLCPGDLRPQTLLPFSKKMTSQPWNMLADSRPNVRKETRMSSTSCSCSLYRWHEHRSRDISIPANSIQTWEDMEMCFHDRFCWP